MIFVTTGSFGFTNLIKTVDNLVEKNKIDDQVIAQISSSKHTPQHIDFFKSSPDILRYMQEAEFVISHGGTGSIMELMMLGKRIIAVPNTDLADNHQYPFLEKLSLSGGLIFCPSLSEESLLEAIQQVKDFTPSEISFYPTALIDQLQIDLTS